MNIEYPTNGVKLQNLLNDVTGTKQAFPYAFLDDFADVLNSAYKAGFDDGKKQVDKTKRN